MINKDTLEQLKGILEKLQMIDPNDLTDEEGDEEGMEEEIPEEDMEEMPEEDPAMKEFEM
jgi:hypothetical protein